MPLKRFTITGCLMIAVFLSSCLSQAGSQPSVSPPAPASPEPEAGYVRITAEEAKRRMDANGGAVILDVRTQEEYDAGHIEGATLIPNEQIQAARPGGLPDLNAEILVYCRSGNRSRQAAEKLIGYGYTAVYDFGGIIDWPYGTVTGD